MRISDWSSDVCSSDLSARCRSRASTIIAAMRSALRATAPTAKSNWARAMRIVIPDSLASSRAHVAHGLLDHLRVDAARLERLGQAPGSVGRQALAHQGRPPGGETWCHDG